MILCSLINLIYEYKIISLEDALKLTRTYKKPTNPLLAAVQCFATGRC